MKKLLALVSVITAAVILALMTTAPIHTASAQATPVVSYQLWTHYEHTAGGINGTPSDSYVARRSDGTRYGHQIGGFRYDLEIPSKGVRIWFSDQNKNIVTFGQGLPERAVDHAPDCHDAVANDFKFTDNGRTIIGLDTISATRVDENAEFKQITKTWMAPKLNCEVVLEEISAYKNTELVSSSTREATKAIIGDPPDELFKLPENPIEVPPSKYLADLGKSMPRAADLDKAYQRQKAARESR